MPHTLPVFKTLADLPDHRSVRIAKANLSVCGCLDTCEQFVHLSNERKDLELDFIRL